MGCDILVSLFHIYKSNVCTAVYNGLHATELLVMMALCFMLPMSCVIPVFTHSHAQK